MIWNVLDVNKHISNISHKANELIVAIVAKIEDITVQRLPSGEKTVFSVSRKAKSNGCTFVI